MLVLPKVSFVISTYNRCDALFATLAQIERCGLDRTQFDIHVVDNASTDGTSDRVRNAFPRVKLITLEKNLGSVAKNEAIPHALGQYIVFLDDDSYPRPGSIERMIRHFEADAKLGAATFTVTLPDGRRECSAYPNVFIGCGVGLRRRAIRLVGTLPPDFFMQAEEYDLSLRLLDAGWSVKTFDDLHVTHLKTPQARISTRTMRLDVRNNFFLILRRFPKRWIAPYLADWMRRYWWIASSKGRQGAFLQGLIEGVLRSALWWQRDVISEEAFEAFAKIDETRRRLAAVLAAHFGESESAGAMFPPTPALSSEAETTGPAMLARLRRTRTVRVLLVDCGKNIHAYWRACRDLGVQVVAIADQNLHARGRTYRGIRIVDDETGRSLPHDLVVIANLSPVHAANRLNQWRMRQDRPVVDLFAPDFAEHYELSDARPAASESHQTAARIA